MKRFRVGPTEKQRSLRFFGSQSRRYHRRAERRWLRPLRARERRAVADLARFDECSGAVIDVGCGTGVHALAAKAAGLRVTAVDISIWAVQRVKGKVDAAFVADIEHLNATAAYEIVLCLGVLDYVAQPAMAFKNLCGLVGPAGRLVIEVPRAGIGGSIHALIAMGSTGLHVNLFTVSWLAREARRWGLELEHARRPLPHNIVAAFRRPAGPAVSPTR